MYKKVAQWYAQKKVDSSFKKRQRAITKAVKHAKGHDGFVVSKAVYLQSLEILAIFASQVEKSGGVSPNVRKAMLSDVLVITQGFVDALVLGDPRLQIGEVRQRYVDARGRSQSKGARGRQAILLALKRLGENAPKNLPKHNVPLTLKAINHALKEARATVGVIPPEAINGDEAVSA